MEIELHILRCLSWVFPFAAALKCKKLFCRYRFIQIYCDFFNQSDCDVGGTLSETSDRETML